MLEVAAVGRRALAMHLGDREEPDLVSWRLPAAGDRTVH